MQQHETGSSAALFPFFDFSIWVECPRSIRLARGLARDGEAARSRWEDDWMPGEERYLETERPRDRAALVCDGARGDVAEGVIILR
jgi:uridine kinase